MTRLSRDVRLSELPAPDLPFKAALECRQCVANFGGSNFRDRPATVAHDRRLQVELKTIAAILERPVIEKILAHLGLAAQRPPKGRAREAGQDLPA